MRLDVLIPFHGECSKGHIAVYWLLLTKIIPIKVIPLKISIDLSLILGGLDF
jgi:hypothetical protein